MHVYILIGFLFMLRCCGHNQLGDKLSGRDLLQELPDIMCLGRSITSGYVPISAALLSENVYTSLIESSQQRGADERDWRGNGGNPIACAAGLETLRIIDMQNEGSLQSYRSDSSNISDGVSDRRGDISDASGSARRQPRARSSAAITIGDLCKQFESDLLDISILPGISAVMGLGNIMVVEFSPSSDGSSKAAMIADLLLEQRIAAKVVGDSTIYLAHSLLAAATDRERLVRVLKRCVTRAYYVKK